MPKFLVQATYSADGLKGLVKDKAAGRKAAVQASVKAIKGKLESFYFTHGESDVVLIVDVPNAADVAALSITAGATGLVRLKSTPLLTVDELDQALSTPVKYRAPGE